MSCDHLKLPGGGTAIVCGRRGRPRHRCCACDLAGGFQCDWKVSATKTCDAYICPNHSLEVAKEKHLCPEHQEAYKAWQAARSAPQDDQQHAADADAAGALGIDWKGA